MKDSSKSANSSSVHDKSETDIDEDVFDGADLASLTGGFEDDAAKTDARRKIEIYWEKKRLKELFEDLDESEFGF
ncbi:MAG: hypothetical protein NTY69_07055 [Methylococcales bacterium]|nr:hypothetical protein [Methylococcales bacterium]